MYARWKYRVVVHQVRLVSFHVFFWVVFFDFLLKKEKKKTIAFTKLWMTNGLGPIRVFTVAQPRTHWTRIARSNRRFSKILEKLGSSLKKQESSLTRPDRGDKQLLEFVRKHLKNPPGTYKYTKHSFSPNQSEVASIILSFPNKQQLLRFSLYSI